MTTTTQLLNPTTTTTRPTLTQLVTESRRPKKPKTSQLDAHRAELLKIRREGAPLRAIRDGLGKLGVVVSEEALRLWFKAHTRRSPKAEARWLAATATALAAIQAEVVATPSSPLPLAAGAKPAGLPVAVNPESSTTAPPVATVMAEAGKPESMHVAAISPAGRPSSLILPGETPLQALRRRLAVLDAERATKGGGTNWRCSRIAPKWNCAAGRDMPGTWRSLARKPRPRSAHSVAPMFAQRTALGV